MGSCRQRMPCKLKHGCSLLHADLSQENPRPRSSLNLMNPRSIATKSSHISGRKDTGGTGFKFTYSGSKSPKALILQMRMKTTPALQYYRRWQHSLNETFEFTDQISPSSLEVQ
jgi:hypothetical protein